MLLRRVGSLLPSTNRGAFWLAFGVCFAVAVAVNLVAAPRVGAVGDFAGIRHDGYWELAANLIRGNGFVFEEGGKAVFHRPPLVPVLFGPLTLLPTPLHKPAVVLLHSLMIGLTCALTFDLAKRVFGLSAARWSLVLTLTYPWLYWHVRNPMNVVTQTMCAAIVLYLLSRELLSARDSDDPASQPFSTKRAIMLGLAAAAAILTHGTMLLSIPILLAVAVVIGYRLGSMRTVKISVAAGLIALLTVAPWTYRNWCVTGRFVPVVGGAGLQYFFGHVHWGFDGQDDRRRQWPRIAAASADQTMEVIPFAGYTDPALDEIASHRMVEDMRSHPGRFAKRVALNAVEFYLPVAHEVFMPKIASWPGTAARALQSVWHLGLIALVCAGLWMNRRAHHVKAGWMAVGAVIALASVYCPFVTAISLCMYCLPTLPLLAFAGASVFAEKSRPTEDVRLGQEVSNTVPKPVLLGRSKTRVALTLR